MVTKSIRLTDEEADELHSYLGLTGEVEGVALKRAAMRGLRELRLEKGIMAYLGGQGSAAAAEMAGLPRAAFLQALVDRRISLLEEPSALAMELEELGEQLGNDRLRAAASKLAGERE
ncbi:MAG: hypothetical protein IT307_04925 [Chloroflexi bacterium]|nr:hypothetical protein [Chloroflexota bacterium]